MPNSWYFSMKTPLTFPIKILWKTCEFTMKNSMDFHGFLFHSDRRSGFGPTAAKKLGKYFVSLKMGAT